MNGEYALNEADADLPVEIYKGPGKSCIFCANNMEETIATDLF